MVDVSDQKHSDYVIQNLSYETWNLTTWFLHATTWDGTIQKSLYTLDFVTRSRRKKLIQKAQCVKNN